MNITTKLLIALPALAMMSACTTSSPKVYNNSNMAPAYDTQTMVPEPYSCGNASNIVVDYTNSSVTRLDATVPEIGLSNRRINLYREVSGSGALYVDRLNPNSTITWHSKANEAVFAVDWVDGTHYQIVCNRT